MKEVYIFPWQRPFLADLKEFVNTRTEGKPGHAVVIVPHKRPARYIYWLYSLDKKPSLIPKIVDFSELVALWSQGTQKDVPHSANILDQVALLWSCMEEVAQCDPQLAARLSDLDETSFLPWGIRLASLLDEFLQHNVGPFDIANLDEGAPIAKALLESLGKIDHAYKQALEERGWITPGLACKLAREHPDLAPPLFRPGKNHFVFIAGFGALNATENAVFQKMWENGAYVCLHADTALLEGDKVHWTCQAQFAWLRKWHAKPVAALENYTSGEIPAPEVTFFSAYDGHSQLEEMSRILRAPDEDNMNTALVLCDENLLMPVLHNLPDRNVNISMGYPLARSPLFSLLRLVFSLQRDRNLQGAYYWRDLFDLFNSFWFSLLKPKGAKTDLRQALETLRHDLRQGSAHIRIEDLRARAEAGIIEPEFLGLFNQCLEILLERPASMRTTAEMASALTVVCDLFIENLEEFHKKYPLDGEAAQRLLHNVLPVFRNNAMSSMPLDLGALKYLFDNFGRNERIPFEADPIVGLQILGMLETRLLQFDRLLFLDASDDILPGSPAQDPLLPDSLRAILGLPDSSTREQAVAYNLYRLCAGAKKVHFLWPEGISHSRLLSAKKIPSRFVEQFLWREEVKCGKIIKPGEEIYKNARAHIGCVENEPKALNVDEALKMRRESLLRHNISASLLNEYLDCPIAFAWKRLLKLSPVEEVNEGDDPLAVGEFIHEVLKEFFDPAQGHELSETGLLAIFDEKKEKSGLKESLPPQSMIALDIAGPMQLKKLLEKHDSRTMVRAVELSLKRDFSFAGKDYHLAGKIDRLDERDGKLYILDYKTGGIPRASGDFWLEDEFFARLENYCQDPDALSAEADSLLEDLRANMESIQLPFYMILAVNSNALAECAVPGARPVNAAFVELKDSCQEKPLFGKNITENPETLARAISHCETAVAFVLEHIRNARTFFPSPSRTCPKGCAFYQLCNSKWARGQNADSPTRYAQSGGASQRNCGPASVKP